MKTNLLRAVIAALLAAMAIGLGSCGGDDDGGGENGPADIAAEGAAYLESLAAALADVNGQLEELDSLRIAVYEGGADPAAADAYGAAFVAYHSDRLAAIEAQTPDEAFADDHAALAAAAGENAGLAESFHEELIAAPPESEETFLAIFGALDGASVTSRYRDACTVLQLAATAGGAEVDLQCLR